MNTSNYNALMIELKKEYLESFEEKFIKLKEFFKNEDWYSIELEYHKLKGTGTTYGLPEVTELCQQLERICRDNKNIKEDILNHSIELLTKIREKHTNNAEFELKNHPLYLKICNQK